MEVTPINSDLVHLASAVAEAEDGAIPILLLDIKKILDSEQTDKQRALLFCDVWKFEFPQMILTVLEQDFRLVTGSWFIACQLCATLLECCCGFADASRNGYPLNIASAILSIISKIIQNHKGADKVTQQVLCSNLSMLVSTLTDCMKSYPSTTVSVLSSKYFMQFFIYEDVNVSLIAFSCLKNTIRVDKSVFYHVYESRIHNIIDEIIFKITSTNERTLARVGINTLLMLISVHPQICSLFPKKRYNGFKKYLQKWKGQGFDVDIEKLLKVLNACEQRQFESHKRDFSATKIQAVYRGYVCRKRLRKAHQSITLLKQIYLKRKKDHENKKLDYNLEKVRVEHEHSKRRQTFVDSRQKTLQAIKNIPAETVDDFFDGLRNDAAQKIQAAWFGYKTRTLVKSQTPHLKRTKAAILIQRTVRKWLMKIRKRKQDLLTELLPSGLTDERKVELQCVIANIRERFQVSNISDDDLSVLHEKSFRMLNDHVINLRRVRRRDIHRKALLAQIQIQNRQFSLLPSLNDVSKLHIEQLSSHSTPIIIAAREAHFDFLKSLNQPWRKKTNIHQEMDFLKTKVSINDNMF